MLNYKIPLSFIQSVYIIQMLNYKIQLVYYISRVLDSNANLFDRYGL